MWFLYYNEYQQRVCLLHELTKIVDKVNELDDSSVGGITEHPEFNSVCLVLWVLQTAHFQCGQ